MKKLIQILMIIIGLFEAFISGSICMYIFILREQNKSIKTLRNRRVSSYADYYVNKMDSE